MISSRGFSRAAAMACAVFAFGCSAKDPDGGAGARDAGAGAGGGQDGGFSDAQGGSGGQNADADAGTCLGGGDRAWAGLSWTTSAAWLRGDYAGPAVVERSTHAECLDPDAVLILDVFSKQTQATPKDVIENCQRRLKLYDKAARGRP